MKDTLDNIKQDKHWYCPLPFNHIYSNSDGAWMPCCLSRPTPLDKSNKKIVHTTESTSMIDWWKSDVMNGIRDEMTGKSKETAFTDHYCFKCKEQERVEGNSSRLGWKESILKALFHHESSMNTIMATDAYVDYREMDLSDIDSRFLNLKLRIFGNICNLSCYMCWPHNSTQRINDIKKLSQEHQSFWFKEGRIPETRAKIDNDQFQNSLDQIKEISHLISSIKITGGEPMMMNNHYKLLDLLISSGDAKHIELRYQTNFTKFSRGEEAFFKYIKQFKFVTVHISIDSVGEYDEYIRKNGSTETVDKNIDKLRNLDNVSFGIANTVSMLSILNHAEFHQKWKDVYVNYFVLTTPKHLNIKHLPDKIKQRLLQETTQQNIINMLKQDRDDSEFQKGIKYCLDLDILYKRNRGIFDIWPELKEYYVQSS